MKLVHWCIKEVRFAIYRTAEHARVAPLDAEERIEPVPFGTYLFEYAFFRIVLDRWKISTRQTSTTILVNVTISRKETPEEPSVKIDVINCLNERISPECVGPNQVNYRITICLIAH